MQSSTKWGLSAVATEGNAACCRETEMAVECGLMAFSLSLFLVPLPCLYQPLDLPQSAKLGLSNQKGNYWCLRALSPDSWILPFGVGHLNNRPISGPWDLAQNCTAVNRRIRVPTSGEPSSLFHDKMSC